MIRPMAHYCHKCNKEISLSPGSVVGRRAECEHCHADVHVCFNCKFYDKAAYNECKEPQADRVIDKDRSNFCDYFSFVDNRKGTGSGTDKNAALAALDKLFK